MLYLFFSMSQHPQDDILLKVLRDNVNEGDTRDHDDNADLQVTTRYTITNHASI